MSVTLAPPTSSRELPNQRLGEWESERKKTSTHQQKKKSMRQIGMLSPQSKTAKVCNRRCGMLTGGTNRMDCWRLSSCRALSASACVRSSIPIASTGGKLPLTGLCVPGSVALALVTCPSGASFTASQSRSSASVVGTSVGSLSEAGDVDPGIPDMFSWLRGAVAAESAEQGSEQ